MISVIKKLFFAGIILLSTHKLAAQNTFEQQFDHAKNLYNEEKYFDAVTEFKRLLFFDESNKFMYEANLLIALSYKYGTKYSDAVTHFTIAELNSITDDQIFEAKIEIIKINILRR